MNLKQSITSYGRFKGAPWFDPISNSVIFVGGVGGIGSHLAFCLARTGAHIIAVDPDTVSEENLAGQLYGKDDIGKKKVEAMSDVLTRLCGETNITTVDEWIKNEEGTWQTYLQQCDVVTVGFDNLEARRIVYEYWKENGKETSLFVDGRLNFEEGEIFVLDKKDSRGKFEAYERTYFSADERIELPCTLKATTHCGSLIANLMTAQIVNWFANMAAPTFGRSVNNVEFHLPIMLVEFSKFKVKEYVDAEIV